MPWLVVEACCPVQHIPALTIGRTSEVLVAAVRHLTCLNTGKHWTQNAGPDWYLQQAGFAPEDADNKGVFSQPSKLIGYGQLQIVFVGAHVRLLLKNEICMK